jgi:hypothetical protein
MAEHGGYREPANPAPVSGPGAHSRRTDGQPTMDLPDAQYGENAAFREAQSGAKIDNAGVQQAARQGAQASVTPLGAPTGMPDVPVTAGADLGPGESSQALGGMPPVKQDSQHLAKYLPALIDMAEQDDTPPGMKTWVRNIIANM